MFELVSRLVMTRLFLVLSLVLSHALAVGQSVSDPSQLANGPQVARELEHLSAAGIPAAKFEHSSEVERGHAVTPRVANVPTLDPSQEMRERADLIAQEEMAYWAKWMFWATAAGAAFSLVAAWLLYQTLKLTRTSTEKQLRAYVSAHFVALPQFLPDHSIEVQYSLMNHGQTPASKFRCCIKTEVWPYPLPSDWDLGTFDNAVPGSFVLHPDQRRTVAYTSTNVIDRESVNRILSAGDIRLYVVGEIHYEDVFGRQQKTWFCTSSVPNLALKTVSEGREVKEGIRFADADQGNGAT